MDPDQGNLSLALDDPFGDAPLPSFPIEDASPMSQRPGPASHAAGPASARSSRPLEAGLLDEEALEEVEFFTGHGMFDEARAILQEQLARMPNHPLLHEKHRELEAAIAQASASESGPREVPMSEIDADELIDRSFDIAASLDALDALEMPEAEAPLDADNQVSVETVFEQFKKGVAAQISESDAATHYDLGVAYKEMGLSADAISEFELASRDPTRECVCQSMIGMMHMEAGNFDAGIDAFIRGRHAPVKTPDQELALTYEIGNAYEQRKNPEQALYYFQLVERLDPNYNHHLGAVASRIARLTPEPKSAPKAAVGAENVADEFDAAFDELLGSTKLP